MNDIPLQLVSCLAHLLISTSRYIQPDGDYSGGDHKEQHVNVILVWLYRNSVRKQSYIAFEINLQHPLYERCSRGIVILHQVGDESAERLLKTERKQFVSTLSSLERNRGRKILGGEKGTHPPWSQSRNDRRLTSGAWELAPNYLGLLRLNLDFQKYIKWRDKMKNVFAHWAKVECRSKWFVRPIKAHQRKCAIVSLFYTPERLCFLFPCFAWCTRGIRMYDEKQSFDTEQSTGSLVGVGV
jgi:hypothetical protein